MDDCLLLMGLAVDRHPMVSAGVALCLLLCAVRVCLSVAELSSKYISVKHYGAGDPLVRFYDGMITAAIDCAAYFRKSFKRPALSPKPVRYDSKGKAYFG